ncbi:hypothetical protein [uncultured Draconibacterium sp.]|uniref:beta strand repeat-containing protein n=1 Tax=uncultured Draconibacterium sp. TaxID=1573823 RepID=UPI0029C8B603|nr:hypothetical protein [uncultured Draconibacterium sp.]
MKKFYEILRSSHAALKLLMMGILLLAANAGFGQTLSLDQADLDYAPGETVYITGTGWHANEVVSLLIMNETRPELNETPHYAEWFETADEDGNFYTLWDVTDEELNTSLVLTALGQSSGYEEQVFFTDGGNFSYEITPGYYNTVSMTAGSTDNSTLSVDVTAPRGNGDIIVNLGFEGSNIGTNSDQINLTTNTDVPFSTGNNQGSGDTKTFPITVSVGTSVADGSYNFEARAVSNTGNPNNGQTWNFTVVVGSTGGSIASVSVGTQSEAVIYGTASSPTFDVTSLRDAKGTVNGTYSVEGLPAGVTSSFSPESFTSSGGDPFPGSTLTLNVPSTLDAGSYDFTVWLKDGAVQASAIGTLIVEKADQTIAWDTPANIVYGTTLSATQLNATVTVPGSEAHGAVTYAPDFGTELNAGTHTLTVNVAGSDNYNPASETVQLTVEKADQTIAWDTPANIVYGTTLSATQLNATVTVPGSEAHGAVTYDPDFGTELNAGTHTLTVNVAGSDNYNPASETVQLTVEKADQTIAWDTPANIVYGTTLSATQLNATVTVPGSEAHGAVTYDPDFGTELNAGTHTLTVNVAGSDNYNPASETVQLTVEKADQTIAWDTPANIVYGTTLSATQLNATVTVPGSEAHGAVTYDPDFGTELNAGTHTLTVNVAGSDNYNPASETVQLTVEKADQTIAWDTPANIVYGTTLSATQLNATVTVPGSEAHGAVTYDPDFGTELNAGTHTLTVNVAGSDNYNPASETVQLTVEKADQTIAWDTPANIVYGTTLSATQLNATVTVPGSEAHGAVTYDPDFGTELNAGTHTLTVNVAGSDNYNPASETVQLTVEKADQTIAWDTPANIVYGTTLSATQLNATVTVPGSEAHGAVTYDPDFGTELNAGTHTLTVNVAGSDNYNPASETVQLTVEKADQTIAWDTPANIVYGTTLSATQLNATVTVPGSEAHGAVTYDPDFGTELNAGTHTLTVNVAGSDNYNPASETVQLTVEKADQTIAWDTPANIVYGTTLSATQLNATVTVPGSEAHGAVTYDPDFGTELNAGTHTLTVNVAGSDNYNPASETVQLTVEKADQTIAWDTPANIVYGTTLSATQLNATVTVPGSEAHGAVTYDPDFGTELNAGTHTLTVNVAGSDNYNPASETVQLTVEKADQTIAWDTPANIVYGTTLSATQLNATVTVPGSEAHGAVTYDPDFGTELNAGTHTLTVNVAGSDNYNPASETVQLTVEKADQTIAWDTPANIVYGTTLSATQLNATVTVPGSEAHGAVTYDPDFGTELNAGTHTLTVNVAGSDNYNPASETVQLTVEKADQTIAWDTPANIVYGTTLSATQLNATVTVPGSEAHGAVTYDPDFGTELNAGTHTLTVNVAGSDNYNPASETVQLTVEKADQTIAWDTPANIVYGTTLSATQLNATVTVPGSEAHGAVTYDPDFGTELNAGTHTLTVNVAGSDNYNPASETVQLTVEKADQTIAWDTPANIVYGTTLSATQLNATVTVPGSEAHGAVTYDPDFGTELNAGTHTLTVNVAGSDNYNPASETVQLTVEKADQTIAWDTPANIVYGTTLSATQLNATVTVPGSEAHGAVTYDPDFGTELNAGTHTLTVNVAGSDNYNPASETVQLTVEKADQTIAWDTPANIVYGTTLSATQLNATVTVPGSEAHGAVTYDPDFGTELNAGTHTLTVNVAGSDNYNPASETVQLTVEKADQTIAWDTPANIVYGTTLSATQLNATVTVPGSEAHGAVTYDPDFGTELNAGTHTLTVNVAGSDNYNPASETVQLTVEKADQTIAWDTPANIVYGTTLSATQLNATVTVPGSEAHGAVTYDPDFGTELNAGTHTLTVNVAGSDNYNPASETVQLTVEKADQTIAWDTPANIVYGTTLSATQLNATVTVPGSEAHGAVTYDPDFGTELNAGTHTLTVNVAGSDNYNPASETVQLTVEKADQTIAWDTPANIVYGTTLSATQLNATVTVPGSEAHGAVTYDPDFGTELNAGTHTLTVNVAGSDNYNPASETVQLTVEKADQTIAWDTPANIVYGTTLSATQLNATVTVPGSEAHGAVTYDPDFGTELNAGTHTLTVNVAGSDNYNPASETVQLTVPAKKRTRPLHGILRLTSFTVQRSVQLN